jgi:Sortilin, neurotensin receptor 3,
MRLQPVAGWRSLLYSTLLLTGAWAKKDTPSVKSTKFAFIPYNVNYFDDSDVLLFEDAISHNVYRSDNAGEDWSVVDGVPEGRLLELTMHQYDKKRAYIITNERTHYKTDDRGETWTAFEADAQASIFREALTFHGGDPDRIIFNAMDCTGIFCEELVGLPTMFVRAWLTLVDDVYYRWLLEKGQVLERGHCWLPLG